MCRENNTHTGKESLEISKILIFGVGRSGLENENSVIAKALNKLMDYKSIGTRDMCRKWKEKQTKMAPVEKVTHYNHEGKDLWVAVYYCPDCGTALVNKDETGYFNGQPTKFCSECGKALDWNAIDKPSKL